MVSKLSRRFGAHSRSALAAVMAFALAVTVVTPAFGAAAKSVSVRVEGAYGTLFSGVETVGRATIKDSTGKSFDVTPSVLAALDVASRRGAFTYSATYSSGLSAFFVNSIAAEDWGHPSNAWWQYRVNDKYGMVGMDRAELATGDKVLLYYGAEGASPTVASVAKRLVTVGQSLVVTAKQFDENGMTTPLSGATVHVGSFTATSTASGTVRLTMAGVGDYGVRIEKDGYIRSAITTVRVREATAIKSLAVSATDVEVGAVPVVSGVLTSGTKKLAARSVRLWHRAKGSATWVASQTKVTGSAGVVSFSVAPLRSTYYRIVFSGGTTYAPCTSASRLVTIR
jgi:hypothetical protein